MSGLTGVFMLLYFLVVIGAGIFVLVLLSNFVKAHQRCADALETIARKLPGARTE